MELLECLGLIKIHSVIWSTVSVCIRYKRQGYDDFMPTYPLLKLPAAILEVPHWSDLGRYRARERHRSEAILA